VGVSVFNDTKPVLRVYIDTLRSFVCSELLFGCSRLHRYHQTDKGFKLIARWVSKRPTVICASVWGQLHAANGTKRWLWVYNVSLCTAVEMWRLSVSFWGQVKVKIALEQAMRVQRRSRIIDVGGYSAPCPERFTSENNTLYSFYRRLVGPQIPSRRVRKISSPPGLDFRTVQPVAKCYTCDVIPAPWGRNKLFFVYFLYSFQACGQRVL
jgi:hypothetical protein